jgi:O-acetyl-ADP-ribose deacetylase (regulator of RNase III)
MLEISVILGDITRIAADAIVNSANPTLLAGGGVSGAIHRAAGRELEKSCREIGGCPVGEAIITAAFGLPAAWVIHAVGPRWLDGTRGEGDLLRSCYRSILAVADSVGVQELTTPSISTGIYRFPLHAAARIAVETIKSSDTKVRTITFVCFDQATKDAYEGALTTRIES